MPDALSAVTGAYGFTGKYITRRLLARGERVLTLTANPDRPNEFGGSVKAIPFRFDDPDALAANLRGADTLYNTYWVRFDHGSQTYERAVKNTLVLIGAAERAGVRRMVHVSITNPSLHSYVSDSSLPYFHGKAVLEEAIRKSRLEYTILRPAVIFGAEDILINNVAYFLRKFPVFGVPGNGEYRLQPILVEDLADLAVNTTRGDSVVMDAVGPEIFTFNELIGVVARAVGSKARVVHIPAGLALATVRMLGLFLGDVVLTRDEITGLLANLLVSAGPPTGRTRLTDWVREHATTLGRHYASELGRHYR